MRVLVTETLSEQGLELLSKDFQVDVRTDLAAGGLAAEIGPYDALIIRSATQVTGRVLAAAPNLQVVARAGIGLDNVDVEEATRRGIMVVNAPQSNIISAAEQTLALAARAGAQHPAGARRADRRSLGAIGMGRRGARRQDDRAGGPRTGWVARGHARRRLRHAGDRL